MRVLIKEESLLRILNKQDIVPGSKEAITELLSFPEIELVVLGTKSEWINHNFPELKSFIKEDELVNNDSDIHIVSMDSKAANCFQFDFRNPRTSWRSGIAFIKKHLKNSRELFLSFNGLGPVVLYNYSKVKIQKLILESFANQFMDEGYVHTSTEKPLIFENIYPGQGVTVIESSGYNRESVDIMYCEWEDGQVVEGIRLESK